MLPDKPERFSDEEMARFHEDYTIHKLQDQNNMKKVLAKLDKLEVDTADMIKAWNGVVAMSKFLTWVSSITGIGALVMYFKDRI